MQPLEVREVTGLVNPEDRKDYPGVPSICLLCRGMGRPNGDCTKGMNMEAVGKRFDKASPNKFLVRLCIGGFDARVTR